MNASSLPLLLLGLTALAGCVTETANAPLPPEPPRAPDTNVYFYPAQGRTISAEQQDRDKYECNTWAVQQTGFDPSEPRLPPHQRMQIVAGGPPPGAEVGAGAVTGALVGAAVSRPWESGRGALFGALAGAAIGGIAESERNSETNQLQARADANASHAQTAALEQKAGQFRRAIGACLEARGYSVK
ncbi:MAG: glycine zipper 2TM domain-containing protein [Gammaproteobacteria bacterium]